MTEYAFVRMDRFEAGTLDLPVDSERRCRYYVLSESKDKAIKTMAERWPNDKDIRLVAEVEK